MAIYDKDGKVYKLRGPNPLMNTQEYWDPKSVKLINLKATPEVIKDQDNPVEKFYDNVVDIGKKLNLKEDKVIPPQEFLQEIQDSKPEPIIEKPVIVESLPNTNTIDKSFLEIFKNRGVNYYCVPATKEVVYKDKLYGSERKITEYGSKFIFDAIIIDTSDLQIQFWCLQPMTRNSVVFQLPKDGVREQRWWKVDSSEPKTGGFLVIASISDINPDFS